MCDCVISFVFCESKILTRINKKQKKKQFFVCSQADREENIRRVAEVAKLFADSGVVAICSFVSPFADDRDIARKIHKDSDLRFYEVYVNTPLSVCESRDVKGLYKKAREGSIQGFTGVTQAYEAPESPDLIVTTEGVSIEVSCNQVIDLLESEEIIPKQIRDIEVVSLLCLCFNCKQIS